MRDLLVRLNLNIYPERPLLPLSMTVPSLTQISVLEEVGNTGECLFNLLGI